MTDYERAALAAMDARFRWYAAHDKVIREHIPGGAVTHPMDLPEYGMMFATEREARRLWAPAKVAP